MDLKSLFDCEVKHLKAKVRTGHSKKESGVGNKFQVKLRLKK